MFDSFQNDEAVLNRMSQSRTGDETVSLAVGVKCDVQFSNSVTYNREGQQVATRAMVFVTPNLTLDGLPIGDFLKQWTFDYGERFRVERIDRMRYPGQDKISHYEVILR